MTRRQSTSFEYRRAMLAIAIAPLTFCLAPASAWSRSDTRSLSCFHTHTSERLTVAYFADGDYIPQSLAQIDHLLPCIGLRALGYWTDAALVTAGRLARVLHKAAT